jgi:protein phosphatase
MTPNFIEMAALTDVGSVRQFNEDSIVADPRIGAAVLADGMGGHRAGEVASRLATRVVHESLRTQRHRFGAAADPHSRLRAIEQSINRANQAVFEAAQAEPAYHGMGTTLSVALFFDNRVALGHVGDSRIYRFRNGILQLLTRDDSLLRDQIDLGLISAADAGASHNRSLVTRAIGIEQRVRAQLHEDDAAPGDVYILCSDGLNDLVDDTDIELIVGSLRANLPLAANHLVQAAKDNGGHDNVSVILVKVRKRPGGWFARLVGWLWR